MLSIYLTPRSVLRSCLDRESFLAASPPLVFLVCFLVFFCVYVFFLFFLFKSSLPAFHTTQTHTRLWFSSVLFFCMYIPHVLPKEIKEHLVFVFLRPQPAPAVRVKK